MYICAGARARARKNEPCATHWAVRQKARNSPHKPPSPRAASRQRTELRNRAQSPRAARNRIPRAGKQLPRNRRENRAQAKHTHSHKHAVEHPRRPQVPVRDRARRAHQAQRSLHAVHRHRPPRRRLHEAEQEEGAAEAAPAAQEGARERAPPLVARQARAPDLRRVVGRRAPAPALARLGRPPRAQEPPRRALRGAARRARRVQHGRLRGVRVGVLHETTPSTRRRDHQFMYTQVDGARRRAPHLRRQPAPGHPPGHEARVRRGRPLRLGQLRLAGRRHLPQGRAGDDAVGRSAQSKFRASRHRRDDLHTGRTSARSSRTRASSRTRTAATTATAGSSTTRSASSSSTSTTSTRRRASRHRPPRPRPRSPSRPPTR